MRKTLKQLVEENATEKDLKMAEKLHKTLTKPYKEAKTKKKTQYRMKEIGTKTIDLFPNDEAEIRITIKTKTFKTIKIEITDITRELEKFI